MLPFKFYTRRKIFNYYKGLSFFIFIWISKLTTDEVKLVRHEKIHFLQQVETLFVFHWFLYGIFYIISRLKGNGHYVAYRYNPFEMEAFNHEHEVDYLETRRPFAWTNYVGQYFRFLSQNYPGLPRKRDISYWGDLTVNDWKHSETDRFAA